MSDLGDPFLSQDPLGLMADGDEQVSDSLCLLYNAAHALNAHGWYMDHHL